MCRIWPYDTYTVPPTDRYYRNRSHRYADIFGQGGYIFTRVKRRRIQFVVLMKFVEAPTKGESSDPIFEIFSRARRDMGKHVFTRKFSLAPIRPGSSGLSLALLTLIISA